MIFWSFPQKVKVAESPSHGSTIRISDTDADKADKERQLSLNPTILENPTFA